MPPRRQSARRKAILTIREIAIFAMLGALMMVCDLIMNLLPNVHLGGVLIVVFTVVYRWKALYPIYVYVFLIGLFEGATLWATYCYVWAILWFMVMLLPRKMPPWLASVVYSIVCALHGFAFGFLWIPSQMVLMSFTFEQALIWWKFGFFTADIPHGIGNRVGSTFILPLVTLIRRLDRRVRN
jgi:energy-coupling factor transport system substrate-specific component